MNFEVLKDENNTPSLIKDMNWKEAKEIDFGSFLKSFPDEKLWREFSGMKYVTSNIMSYNFDRLDAKEVLEKTEELVRGDNHYVAQELISCLEDTVHKANSKNRHDGYEFIILSKPKERRNENEELIVGQIELRTKNLSLTKDWLAGISQDEDLNYVMKLRLLNFLDNFEDGKIEKYDWLPDKISKDNCAVILGEKMIILDNSQEPALADFIREKEKEDRESIASIAATVGNYYADQLSMRNKKDLVGGNIPAEFQEIKKKFPDSILLEDYIKKNAILSNDNVDKEEYCRDFLFLSSPLTRNLLKKELHVSLEELPVKTQFFLLNFLKNKSGKDIESIKTFCAKFGEEGLSSFLSLETGAEIGDRILSIGDNLDLPAAKKVFAKISELAGLIEKSSDEIRGDFGTDKAIDWREARSVLLQRIVDIISGFSGKEDNKPLAPEKIKGLLDDLEDSKTELLFLASILKVAKRQGEEIDFDKIKDLKLERHILDEAAGKVLSEEEKSELKEIVAKNYQEIFLQAGERCNPAAYQRVVEEFAAELENPGQQIIYILKYQEQVVSFARYRKLSEYEVYGGSLNVSRDLRGLSVGKYFTQAAENEISRQYDIRIKSRKDNPANSMYQKNGFVVIGEHQEKDGVGYYDMIKPSSAAQKRAAA